MNQHISLFSASNKTFIFFFTLQNLLQEYVMITDLSFHSNDVFSPSRGSRSNVKKVLIVITDGQSNDRNQLPEAANLAESKNIVRFAIGVSYIHM